MRLLAASCVLYATGCATTLSTLTTAETLPKGDMSVTLGAGGYISTGTIISLADAAAEAAAEVRRSASSGQAPTPTEDQKRKLYQAGLGMALLPPSVMFEASFRYGLMNNLDLGLRYGGSNWRLDAKWRLWSGQALGGRAALALAPGVSRYSVSNIVTNLLEYVKIDDFSRYDAELPLLFSVSWGEIGRFYLAARAAYARYSLDEKLIKVQEIAGATTGAPMIIEDSSGDIIHAGGTLGGALGYKWVHLFLELGVYQAIFETKLLGQTLDLGGIVIYPAGGLTVAW